MKNDVRRYEKVAIDKLIPYARNARTHDAEQIRKIRASMREFGFINPVLIDGEHNIIAGHGRVEAAKAEGMTEIPCLFVEDLTEAQKRAYILADNRLALDAGWDNEMLAIELDELKGLGFNLELTGFDLDELDEIKEFNLTEPEVENDNFDVEDALDEIAEPISKPGQIFQLGNHRLMCGSSTNPDDMAQLIGQETIDLIVTDPPYNVEYVGKTKEALTIENDRFQDDEGFFTFLLTFYRIALEYIKPGGPIYVFHADTEGVNFRAAMTEAGFLLKQCLIWVKNSLVMGRQDYHWRHEPILYGWKPGAAHVWAEDRTHDTVIDDTFNINPAELSKPELVKLIQQIQREQLPLNSVIYHDRPTSSQDHPTMKPITLIGRLVKNSSYQGDAVLDCFGGSGSTLMAAEQLNRRAFLMELDPKYTDVIIKRWETFTGKKAELLNPEPGENIQDTMQENAGK